MRELRLTGHHLEPNCAVPLWPEVLADLNGLSEALAVSRAQLARLAIGAYRQDSAHSLVVPDIEAIQQHYPSIDTVSTHHLPIFQFLPSHGTREWTERLTLQGASVSHSQALRHVLAFQIPRVIERPEQLI